jgi:hypothetical protein
MDWSAITFRDAATRPVTVVGTADVAAERAPRRTDRRRRRQLRLSDYRAVLDRDDVDIVSVASPPDARGLREAGSGPREPMIVRHRLMILCGAAIQGPTHRDHPR